MSQPAAAFVPAEVFHPSDIIAEESIARDWSIWDFATRIGALDDRVTVLSYTLYALRDPDMHMGDDSAMDLERVFGIDAEIWRRTESLFKTSPAASRGSAAQYIRDWYGLDDEVEEFTPSAPPGDG